MWMLGCRSRYRCTTFDRWIGLPSHTNRMGPGRCRRSWRRKATKYGPLTFLLSGSSSKKRLGLWRLGLSLSTLMAEMRSCRSQAAWMGVCPRGAKVRRRVGLSIKPDSSSKTRWAFCCSAFFLDPLDVAIAPRIDLFFVALSGSMMNLLTGPA